MPPLRIVAPLAAAYVLFLGIVLNSVRRPPARPIRPVRRVAVRVFVASLLRTVAAGYVVFLAIVLVFHVVIARETAALANAVSNGSLLAFVVVVPAFVLLSVAERTLARRRDHRD